MTNKKKNIPDRPYFSAGDSKDTYYVFAKYALMMTELLKTIFDCSKAMLVFFELC